MRRLRILVGYGMGETELKIAEPGKLMAHLSGNAVAAATATVERRNTAALMRRPSASALAKHETSSSAQNTPPGEEHRS